MTPGSTRQRLLRAVWLYQKAHHRPPSIRELAKLTGHSTTPVFDMLERLQGYVDRGPYPRTRTLTLTAEGLLAAQGYRSLFWEAS